MSAEFHSNHETEANVWGGVTDPADHNPANFRYLIHAINPNAKSYALAWLKDIARFREETARELRYKQSMGYQNINMHHCPEEISHDQPPGDQGISMYHFPERLADRIFLSMSLIDQDHTYTWGDIGLIVGAFEANIVLTAAEDACSYRSNLKGLLQRATLYEHMSGDELLQNSDPLEYNEVVAVAQSDDWQLQLEGFFYKTTPAGHPCDSARADKMHRQALRLDLPIVAIAGSSILANRVKYT